MRANVAKGTLLDVEGYGRLNLLVKQPDANKTATTVHKNFRQPITRQKKKREASHLLLPLRILRTGNGEGARRFDKADSRLYVVEAQRRAYADSGPSDYYACFNAARATRVCRNNNFVLEVHKMLGHPHGQVTRETAKATGHQPMIVGE